MLLYHRVMSAKVADGMTNSEGPDQTASFAQACLLENLGSYIKEYHHSGHYSELNYCNSSGNTYAS